ncbi:hypothetical protein [Thiolapillus sp.]|uniref:hypothetical protein n=1 Tax=Thiolapillus sp. TaxID=2017437 RepID=UPI003AF7BCAD
MFSLWRKARRENSAASRLLGTTSLRFALHGWQRRIGTMSLFRPVLSWKWPSASVQLRAATNFPDGNWANCWPKRLFWLRSQWIPTPSTVT